MPKVNLLQKNIVSNIIQFPGVFHKRKRTIKPKKKPVIYENFKQKVLDDFDRKQKIKIISKK